MAEEADGRKPTLRLLDGIDLVVFDKDGTLIDFHAMWGGWAIELAERLEASVRRPITGDVFALLGFDPGTGRVAPAGPLATATMGAIEDLLTGLLRRWCPSVAAAQAALARAWFVPDPVRLARPLADLGALFGRLRASGRELAVVTADDREPTEATLVAFGVRGLVSVVVGGDEGIAGKPAPDAVLAVAAATGVAPDRMVVVGDTPADLRMGRAAGVRRVVAVLSGLGTLDELAPLADSVVADVGGLGL